jgi:type I restriction enzyme S subunit
LPVPPLTEQQKIARILKSLSNKLVCNTQTNKTIEAMAQAIFKSWFVDFDPVKAKIRNEQPEGMDALTAELFPDKLVESELGLIPEGWEVKPLYDIAEYINGAAYKKFEPNTNGLGFPIVKIVELKSGITDKTGFSTVKMPEKYKLNDKDILFSWSGNPDTSIDTFIWALGEAWLNQHIFKVIPKPIITRNFLLSLLKSMRSVFAEIARDKQTTGLGHVTVKDLKRLMVALPSKELLAKFDDAVSAIINQQFNLVKQTQNLEKLRDTLLPKLLSGELELTNEELTDES